MQRLAQGVSDMGGLWQLLTLAIAAVVAYVSWNQYRIARNKLRLDLFDKRYKVFEGARTLLAFVVREGALPMPELQRYWIATTDRKFLFGSEVLEYLESLDKHASAFHTYNLVMQHDSGADAEARAEAIEIDHREMGWLSDELLKGGLQAKFAPYLQFAGSEADADLLTPTWRIVAGTVVTVGLVGFADWRDWLPCPDLWSYRVVGGITIEGDAPWCRMEPNDAASAACAYLSEQHCKLQVLGDSKFRICTPNPFRATRD